MDSNPTGIGMISGGLDSLLATIVLKNLGVRLRGVHFLNGFAPGSMKDRVYRKMSMPEIAAEKEAELSSLFGIQVDVVDLSDEFLQLLDAPRHGFGKNINPCIDCRIFLLRKAKEIMIGEKADFIYTGEVLGQRPMSQHLNAMRAVEKESGLQGILLRPLSAKLLAPTICEKEGLIDRERLLDIQGRTRRRQLELAEEFGLSSFQSPGGGCTLTDENYARKFIDLRRSQAGAVLTVEEMVLLSTGRHLRLSPETKIVVGRNQEENEYFEDKWGDSILAAAVDLPGPTVIIQGGACEEDFLKAAAVTARYGQGKDLPMVKVSVKKGEEEKILEVAPASDEDLERWRI
ncbi:MAG: thiamine biosynthesis protein [Candidatus Krumholzibacteriota bacterium]|nr:thiamine biosynthesis protein [Candidatus Krumholzibacteriota bacterium]